MQSNGNNNRNGQVKTKRKNSSPPPLEVRDSPIHGKGAFATRKIHEGERIIEYLGERMPWDAAAASENPDDPHTFLFGLSDANLVLNAAIGGNDSRWINHSCDPNCEAVEERKRVFIYALRDVEAGEELFYDYGLQIDEPRTSESEKQFRCFCGAATCRGTLLEPEEEEAEEKQEEAVRN
jgi:uncharacterized protein